MSPSVFPTLSSSNTSTSSFLRSIGCEKDDSSKAKFATDLDLEEKLPLPGEEPGDSRLMCRRDLDL